MEFIERLNRSMEYIEQHLRIEIDLDRAARCAYLSKDSFLRLFSQMTGMTVAQYVRRRRMTLAVTDLRQSDDKILDIALRYGYDSGDAFTRAFALQHGVSPKTAREADVPLKHCPPLSFSVAVHGGREMDFRLVDVESGPLFGFLEQLGDQKSGETAISAIWSSRFPLEKENQIRKTVWYGVWKDGKYALSQDNGAVWYGFWKEGRHAVVPTEAHSGEDRGFTLTGGRYAVFGMEPSGTAWETISELRESILKDCLPAFGYARKEGAFFEIYRLWADGEQGHKVRYYELWLPIQEEKEPLQKPAEQYPLISVLIPVYQAEEYLARCVDSALAQTYPNIEIVLVDDGSIDNSSKVTARYAKRPNVRYYREEHRGVSHARNCLVERAKGDLLFFLDADDCLEADALTVLADLLEKHNADIAQCGIQYTWIQKSDEADLDFGKTEVYESENLLTRFCCWALPLMRVNPVAKLYRREVFRNIHFPEGKIHEDEAVMHRIVGNCERIVCTDLRLYRYNFNPTSITRGKFTYRRYDCLDAIADRYRHCAEQGLALAEDMSVLQYLKVGLDLYRKTYTEISPTDEHLRWLQEECRKAAEYLIQTGRFSDELVRLFIAWRTNPLFGEMPSLYPIGNACYQNWLYGEKHL